MEAGTLHFTSGSSLIVVIGSSSSNSKTASAPAGYTCPTTASKSNWVGTHAWHDTFSINQSGPSLMVKRTDKPGGWGMTLRIRCTRDATPAGSLKITRGIRHNAFKQAVMPTCTSIASGTAPSCCYPNENDTVLLSCTATTAAKSHVTHKASQNEASG